MKKTIGLTLGLACFGLLLMACDESGTAPGKPVPAADLVGKWVMTRSLTKATVTIIIPGQPASQQPINDTSDYTTEEYFAEFKTGPDTYSANFPGNADLGIGGEESGTWTVSGDVITTVSTDNVTSKIKAVVNGSSGTFVVTLNRDIAVGAATGKLTGTSTLTATKQ